MRNGETRSILVVPEEFIEPASNEPVSNDPPTSDDPPASDDDNEESE